jgi:hypothetical protein
MYYPANPSPSGLSTGAQAAGVGVVGLALIAVATFLLRTRREKQGPKSDPPYSGSTFQSLGPGYPPPMPQRPMIPYIAAHHQGLEHHPYANNNPATSTQLYPAREPSRASRRPTSRKSTRARTAPCIPELAANPGPALADGPGATGESTYVYGFSSAVGEWAFKPGELYWATAGAGVGVARVAAREMGAREALLT